MDTAKYAIGDIIYSGSSDLESWIFIITRVSRGYNNCVQYQGFNGVGAHKELNQRLAILATEAQIKLFYARQESTL